jgi:spore germination protein KC
MKKDIVLMVLTVISGVLLFLSLIGFKNPIDIPGDVENNYFVIAAGIDKATDGIHKYKVTAIGEKFSGQSGGSSSSQGKTPEIVCSEGDTIFEIFRNFSLFKSKSMFWGHIKYLLISEDIAKENILDILDVFIRDHELRFDISIAIVKNTTAESFIRIGDQIEQYTPDLLEGIFHNVGKLSLSTEVKLIDAMENFNNTYLSVCLPTISTVSRKNSEIDPSPTVNQALPIGGGIPVGTKINEESQPKKESTSQGSDSSQSGGNSGSSGSSGGSGKTGQSSSSSSGPKDILYQNLNGFAVFDGTKLFGYITDYMARGLNWVKGKIESGVIVIKDKNNKPMSMEIISSKSEIKTKVVDDKPEATITIGFSTNLGEVMDQENISTEETTKSAIQQQNEIIKKEVENVVEYAQKNGLDILDISDVIHHEQPLKWEKMEDNWKEILKTMKISVEVKSNINRTYHIREPIRSSGGGK